MIRNFGRSKPRRLSDTQYYFRSERWGNEYETVMELIHDVPGRLISWRTLTGPKNSGIVSFDQRTDGSTQLSFRMDYEPDACFQQPAFLTGRLESHLESFKAMIERVLLDGE